MKMKHLLLKAMASASLLFSACYLYAADPASPPQPKSELAFIKNKGQIHDEHGKNTDAVLYYTELKNTGIFFQKNTVSYIQYNSSDKKKPKAHKVDVRFLNSNPAVSVTTSNEATGRYNFYSDKNREGITNISGYQKLTYHNLYPSIDLVYTVKDHSIKYDIIVYPGANIADIQFQVDGADQLDVKGDAMNIQTSLGTITDNIPLSYYDDAQHTQVDFIHLTHTDNIVSFQPAKYDQTKILVIDPTLQFFNNIGPSTINGGGTGNGLTSGNAIKHDANGDINIVGTTNTLTFYLSPGSAKYSTFNGEAAERAFIAHFNAAGIIQWCSTMEYTDCNITFSDVSANGSVYVVCGTTAGTGSNSGVLPGATYNSANGGSDAFVSIFNSTGGLLKSLYIGGPNDDGATCISDDGAPQTGFLVGGYTYNATLNLTPYTGLYPFKGGKDGFVCTVLPYDLPISGVVFDPIKYVFVGSIEEDEVTDIDFMSNTTKLAVTGTTYSNAAGFSPSITTVIGSNAVDSDKEIFAIHFDIPAFHGSGEFYSYYAASIGTDGKDEDMPKIDVQNYTSPSAVNDFHLSFLTKSSGLNSITPANAYQKNISGSVYNNFYISLTSTLATVNYATYFYQAVTSPVVTPVCVKRDWLSNTYLIATTNSAVIPYTHNNTVSGTGLPGTPATNTSDIMIARFNPDYSLGFLTRTGNIYADRLAEIDVTRVQEVAANCKTLIYLTGITATNTGITYGINSVVKDDNPITILSSNGNNLPTTLSIPNLGSLSSGALSVQWYFNGMPYTPDPYTEVPTAQSMYVNLPGDYYVTVSYGGCTFQTQTVSFGYDCEKARATYIDLALYVSQKVSMGIHKINVPSGNYQIKSGQTVIVPAGYTVNITQSVVLAYSCSRIEVTGNGILNIDHSVLTGCTSWDGILYNGRFTKGTISECGISNAAVGIYRYYGNFVSGESMDILFNNFNNNNLHIALLGTNMNDGASFTSHNFIYANRMFGLKTSACGTYSPYVILKSNMGGSYNCYVYTSGKRGDFFRAVGNYLFGVALNGSRVTGFRGRFLRDVQYVNNFYRALFKSGIDANDAHGLYVSYEDMKSNNNEYGIRVINPISNADIDIQNCTLQNGNPANIAGISVKNATYSDISDNYVSGYTNGIEFFDNEYIGFDTGGVSTYGKRNEIRYNIIYPLRSGVVVSYDKDPYIATLGENNYPSTYWIGVWIKCNYIEGGNYGILGSGRLVDQIYQPLTVPTPPAYIDPGNVFNNILNWDLIWDHAYVGGPGFTYYANPAHMPNTPTNPSPTTVVLNGHSKGIGFNDFLISNFEPGGIIPINQMTCAPTPPRMAQAHTGTKEKEALTLSQNMISVYPNPSYESFSIEFNNEIADRIEIQDVLGKEVYTINNINTNQTLVVNSANWTSGVYFIKVYNGNKLVLTKKLLKND
ncbi:MAG: T9SS type A sorting domain-containing protein [Bacteroidota bacterium]